MTNISNDLIEAYKGYYEDELDNIDFNPDSKSWEEEVLHLITEKIKSHTPKERLEVYLEWNGIRGYASRIYEIATGEL